MKNHHRLKLITIILSGVYTPLGVYIGYQLGLENYSQAGIGICVTMLLSIIDSIIFWKLIEKR